MWTHVKRDRHYLGQIQARVPPGAVADRCSITAGITHFPQGLRGSP
jgi:hypothetical protein